MNLDTRTRQLSEILDKPEREIAARLVECLEGDRLIAAIIAELVTPRLARMQQLIGRPLAPEILALRIIEAARGDGTFRCFEDKAYRPKRRAA